MTTTADMPMVAKHLMMLRRDGKNAGSMYSTCDECPKKKKKKKKEQTTESILNVESLLIEKSISKDMGNGKWKLKGKVGVWRTVMGRRRFFPSDGSGVIPPFERSE